MKIYYYENGLLDVEEVDTTSIDVMFLQRSNRIVMYGYGDKEVKEIISVTYDKCLEEIHVYLNSLCGIDEIRHPQ
jgi:hypothetical protein